MKKKTPLSLGPVQESARGFEFIQFKDRNETVCSLQVSSIADHDKPGVSAVWLGPDDAAPKVLWREAASVGVKTAATEGWVPYPVPSEVLLTTRAHLSRENVAALINHLQSWLDNDTLEIK